MSSEVNSTTKELRISRADSWAFRFPIKDDATGLAKDVTGFSAKFTVKKNKTDTSNAFQLVSPWGGGANAGIDFPVPTSQGFCDVYGAPGTTSSLAPGPYYYDLQVVDPAAKVFTVCEGIFLIKYDITSPN